MSMFTLWLLIVVLPGLDALFSVFTIASTLLAVLAIIACFAISAENEYAVRTKEEKETDHDVAKTMARKWLIPVLAILTSSWILSAITPSREEVYWIAGGYFATNIENIEHLPPNLVNAANKFLEDFSGTEMEK